MFAESVSATPFSETSAAVGALAGDFPVVGYESGKDLEFAVSAGFETVGKLRILVSRNAHS